MISWAHLSPQFKGNLDRLSRSARLTNVTDQQTDRPRYSVCNNSLAESTYVVLHFSLNSISQNTEYHRRLTVTLSKSVNALYSVFLAIISHNQSMGLTHGRVYKNINKLECGPMPNVMAALPNIGDALCSTQQSLADAQY